MNETSDEFDITSPAQNLKVYMDENTQQKVLLTARLIEAELREGYDTDSTIGDFRIESEIEESQKKLLTPPTPRTQPPINSARAEYSKQTEVNSSCYPIESI